MKAGQFFDRCWSLLGGSAALAVAGHRCGEGTGLVYSHFTVLMISHFR